MSRFAHFSLLCATVVLSLFPACSKSSSSSKKTHQFRMNIMREPPTMDPRKGSEMIGSAMHYLMFEGLVRLNPDGSVTPAQAKSVDISDDRKTYTFHMRGTQWSDGSAVTAFDFEKAWKKILSPDFPASNAPLLYPVKNAEAVKRGALPLDAVGIRATDENTLVVQLENPTPYFLDLISFCVFFPVKHEIDEQFPEWAYEAGPHFITNGPFKLKSWKHNNEILFEKNSAYWQSGQIDLDKIQVTMVSDENTVLHMYENGELDIIGLGISPLPNDALLKFQKTGLLKVHPSPGTSIVCFNTDKFPFNNKKIRKALTYAINRQEIVDNIAQTGDSAALNMIPPILRKGKVKPYFKDNDTALAKTLFEEGLKELGISRDEFPEVTYSYSISDINNKLAQALQQQWNQVLGIKIKLQNNEHKVLLDKLNSRTYDMAQSLWVAQYHDEMNIFERFKYKSNAKNYPSWENKEYIRLLEQSAVDPTPQDRSKTFEQAEALFMEEMPLAPIYHMKVAYMLKDHIDNPNFLPNGAFDIARLQYNEGESTR